MYTLVDSATQMEFYLITDVQPMKDVAPHVRETTEYMIRNVTFCFVLLLLSNTETLASE